MVHIELGDSSLSFSPEQANAASGRSKGNTVTYASAYPGVDLRYETRSSQVKESIILSGKDSPSTYTFALDLTNLTPKTNPDGSITLLKPGETKASFTIPKPFMYESRTEGLASQAVTQTVRAVGDKLFLDIIADQTWLADPARQFPVVIDPTAVVGQDAGHIVDTFAASSYPTSTQNNLDYITVGNNPSWGTTRGFIRFALPGLPDGAHISSAQLSLDMVISVTDQTTVEAREVTSSWDPAALTWNNQPTYSGTALSSVTGSNTGWWNFDVTGAANNWYGGLQKNWGIALLASPETANRRTFNSAEYASDPTARPKLSITYTIDPVGDQKFWKYTGDGVNPFNGNLLVRATDLATPGRGVPVTVSRAYNSRATTRLGAFGYGWSSNLDMAISTLGDGPALFWDATGTKHVFGSDFQGGFVPPPGIHYELTYDSGTQTYKVTTLDKTVFTFNSAGRPTTIKDANDQTTTYHRDANGSLTSISDPSGRSTTVNHNADGLVSSVTDPSGRTSTYTYDANKNLTNVTISQGTSSVSLGYGYAVGTNRLTSAQDPKSQTVTFGYDANNRISSITRTVNGAQSVNSYTYGTSASGQATGTVSGPLGRSVTYTFNDNGNPVQSDVVADASGTKLTTTYNWDMANNPTKLTDPRTIASTLNYNANGQLTSVTRDSGNPDSTIPATTNLNYDLSNNLLNDKDPVGNVRPSNYDANNNPTEVLDELNNASLQDFDTYGNLVSATLPISLGDNLVTNPGFEASTSGTPANWAASRTLGAGDAFAVDTTSKSGGYQSLKVTSGSTSGLGIRSTGYIAVIPGASYNLSADLATDSASTAALRVFWFKDTAGTPSVTAGTGDLSVTTAATLEPQSHPGGAAFRRLLRDGRSGGDRRRQRLVRQPATRGGLGADRE